MSKPVGDVYWTNVCDPELPFGGIIEHTNLVPASDYGGRHVVYLSRYHTLDERFRDGRPARGGRVVDRAARGAPARVLGLHGPKVTPFRTPYAAPLPELGHLARIPPERALVPGLFLSTTAQIYPHDRGMDEGLKRGTAVAELMLESLQAVRT